jgi:catechol 2,3-dioxygenase-like lactoylglutathione lyase family enzyme
MTLSAATMQTKFHLSLNVSNLEKAIALYRILFGMPPAKHDPDYPKFEVERQAVIFSLVPHTPSSGTPVKTESILAKRQLQSDVIRHGDAPARWRRRN